MFGHTENTTIGLCDNKDHLQKIHNKLTPTGTDTLKRTGQDVIICAQLHKFTGHIGKVIDTRAGQCLVSIITHGAHLTMWLRHDELKLNIRIVGGAA